MSTIIRVGNRQLSTAPILQHAINSHLLPQLLREIIIDDTLDRWQPSVPIRSTAADPEFDRYIQQLATLPINRGKSALQLQKMAERAIKLQQFKQGIWGNKLASYYLLRKSQLDRVICSIVEVSDLALAQELFFRLHSDAANFAHIAYKYSQGATAIDGGKIGPISMSELSPPIAQQVVRLNPGELSPLFIIPSNGQQTEHRHAFVRLEKLIPAPFDDNLRQLLLDELFEQWLRSRIATEIGSISVRQDIKLIKN